MLTPWAWAGSGSGSTEGTLANGTQLAMHQDKHTTPRLNTAIRLALTNEDEASNMPGSTTNVAATGEPLGSACPCHLLTEG